MATRNWKRARAAAAWCRRAKLAANRKKIEQEQKNTQRTQNQSKDRGAR